MKATQKKITFVTNHLYGGGSERVLVTLANKFSELGFDVSIIAFNAKKRYPINENIMVTEIGDSTSLLKQSSRIRRFIKQLKPNTIVSFEYFVNLATIIAARNTKAKVIISERNDPKRAGAGFGKDQLRNWLYKHCDILVCQTPDAKAYFPEVIQHHTIVIPNPIKEGLPDPYKGPRKHTVVNFCRLNEQKNLKLLIDAFAEFHKKFSDYNLIIYGDGPEKEKVEQYIFFRNLNDAVSLKPNTSNVHKLVSDCSMFVSSSDYEGLSNSMLEAMAIGLPTICTDCPCGGARMIIQNGVNGLLVPVNNQQEMTKAMESIADNKAFAFSLSLEGTKVREVLSLIKIVAEWEKII